MFDKRYQVHWTFFTVKHFEPRPSFFRGFWKADILWTFP